MARDEQCDPGAAGDAGPGAASAGLPVTQPDDLRLARRAVQGEPAARDEVAQRLACVPKFVAVCNQQLGNPLDRAAAEDAAQDATVTVWAKLGTFRGEATLETWAFRITDFTVRNAFRRACKRRPSLDETPEPALHSAQLATVDDREQLQVAIGQLAVEDAAVLQLKHYGEQTFDQIGRTLAISPNTAKTRYYRALANLRVYLQRGSGTP